MEKQQKRVDRNEGNYLHPAIDYRNGTLILGFRYFPEGDKEQNLYVISEQGKLPRIQEDTRVETDQAVFQIEEKGRILARVSDKWNLSALENFINELTDPLYPIENGTVLFNEIKGLYEKYIHLRNSADYTLATAFTLGTYLFQGFPAFPYLHIKAPKGSGKTQYLTVSVAMFFNGVKAQATYPSFRDTVDSQKGVFVMDQADTLAKYPDTSFLANLTDSYKKSSAKIRKMVQTGKKNQWMVEEFDAYVPKCFASIKELPEDLRDRCIIIPLVRTNQSYPVVDADSPIWKEIREKIYRYVIRNHTDVVGLYNFYKSQFANEGEIIGRKFELFGPIACVIGGMLGVDAKEITEAKDRFLDQYQMAQFEAKNLEYEVIRIIFEMITSDGTTIITPKEIAEKIDDEFFEEEFGSESFMISVKRKSAKIGHIIREYNMSVKKLPRSAKGERYAFNKAHLDKIKEGHFPAEEVPDSRKEQQQEPTQGTLNL